MLGPKPLRRGQLQWPGRCPAWLPIHPTFSQISLAAQSQVSQGRGSDLWFLQVILSWCNNRITAQACALELSFAKQREHWAEVFHLSPQLLLCLSVWSPGWAKGPHLLWWAKGQHQVTASCLKLSSPRAQFAAAPWATCTIWIPQQLS